MVRTSLDTWLCYMRTSGIGWTSISWQTGRVTREPHFACERVLPFQLESVNEGHPDNISETTACWSFRVLLTSLASMLQSS